MLHCVMDRNRDEFGRDGPAREKRAPELRHKRKQSTSSDSGLDADSDTFAFDMSEAVPHHRSLSGFPSL